MPQKIATIPSTLIDKKRVYDVGYRAQNKERICAYAKEYRRTHPDKIRAYMKEYWKRTPWLRSYHCARQRCLNSKNSKYRFYGGRGIKFKLTLKEIEQIWFRDNGQALNSPSIDRIDSDKDYCLGNCRFIERTKNKARGGKRRKYAKN